VSHTEDVIIVSAEPDSVITVQVQEQPVPEPILITLDDGTSIQVAYHHTQGLSSDTWEIEHNLGFYPNITTMDSAGTQVEGELQHLSKYRLRVNFSAPISGQAFLS
jgi:hypothetical protein